MLSSLVDTRIRSAADGVGRAAVVDRAELAVYREQLLDSPLMKRIPSDAVRAEVLRHIRFTRYLAGYAVMKAGEVGDRLGFLLSGRCRVVVQRADTWLTVGWIGPGEPLGEMSYLTDTVRRHTVCTDRDTVIAELYFDDFRMSDHPELALIGRAWISEIAAARALGLNSRPKGMTISVMPLDDREGEPFAQRLLEAFRAAGDTCAVVTRATWPGLPTVAQLAEIERDHDYVVYVASRSDDVWTDLANRQSDRLLIVADAAGDPKMTSNDLRAAQARVMTLLVLLQPDVEVAADTARWLKDRDGLFPLHVRRNRPADYARCMRLITGRGRGVVFAGASSRGIGYAGMIQAFEALGFEPDIVAGNSSGSMAAVMLAMGRSSAETLDAYRAGLSVVRPSWRNATLPAVSLLSGAVASRYIRSAVGDARLEDLLVPCIVTTVDLSTLETVDLHQGPAWRSVRASGSLPVYYPPVSIDGRLLVDGGVLDNFPVRPLMPFCGRGVTVICDLSQNPAAMTDIEPYGTELSGFRLLLRRLWPFGRRRHYPYLPEIVFRTTCLASLHNQTMLRARAEPGWLFIRPETEPIDLFGATDAQLPALLDACRGHTIDCLTGSDIPAVAALFGDGTPVGRSYCP